jgi:hypothetical protein
VRDELQMTLREIPRADTSADVIEILEELLDRAREGKIRAVAVAVHTRVDGTETGTGSAYSLGVDGDIAHLITGLERLKLRLLWE